MHESADWFNSRFIAVMGANLNMTRTPDTHFISEVRHAGAKLTVFSPDFSQVAEYADYWIPVNAGQDTAFWMAVNHIILQEFYVDRQVPYFIQYLQRYTDMPFLVQIEQKRPGRYLRARDVAPYQNVENVDWKLLVYDAASGSPRLPQGTIGFRWADQEKGRWNLEMKDALSGEQLEPELSFLERHDAVLELEFDDFGDGKILKRSVPVRYIETEAGRVAVTTVFDLTMAQFGVSRGLPGDYPGSYDDEKLYTPAWQEALTGIHRDTLVRFAREWASNGEKTQGKNLIIIGAGANHWYSRDVHQY